MKFNVDGAHDDQTKMTACGGFSKGPIGSCFGRVTTNSSIICGDLGRSGTRNQKNYGLLGKSYKLSRKVWCLDGAG